VLEQQAKLIETTALYSAGYGGVGAGKTLGAQLKMWERLQLYPFAGHYVCGADFEQLRNGYFLDFRELLGEVLGWEEGRDFTYHNLPRPEIRLASGARLRSLSAELAQRIRSTRIHSLHCEEPQTWHNGAEAWRTLVGRMRHSIRSSKLHPDMPIQAWMTFNPISCPAGSWLHSLITKEWPKHGYPAWRFSLRDNYLLEGVEQVVRNLEANLPPSEWPVEIDGNFPTSGGGAYREYDETIHCLSPNLEPPVLRMPFMGLRPEPICWSLDFNVGLMCSVVAQPWVQAPIVEYVAGKQVVRFRVNGWQRRVFYIIDEIALPDAGIEDVCDRFIERYGDHCKKHRDAQGYGVYVYGDASGGARSQLMSSQSAVRTNWEAVKARLTSAGISVKFRVPSANPSQLDRVNMVNRQFRIGQGYGMLVNPQACPVLITDFGAVKIDPKTNAIDKSDKTEEGLKRTHMSDALGYMVHVERKLEGDSKSITWSVIR